MRTSSPCSGIRFCTIAAFGTVSLLGTPARAADLGPSPLPPLTVETWTGFSLAVGGGIGIFNANVNTSANREDNIQLCDGGFDVPNGIIVCDGDWVTTETFRNSQGLSIDDLGDEGGFGTLQLAYDRQIGSQWVLGAFVDADLYGGMDATGKQVSASANDHFDIPITGFGPVDFGAESVLAAKTEIGLDWSFSVGGRIGWLATPSTLLYFLAAYTHAELDKARLEIATDAVFTTTQLFEPVGGGGCGVFGDCPLSRTVNLPKSLDGYTFGGGSEVKLGGPWSAKFEYRYTHLDGEKGRLGSDSAQAFAIVDVPNDGTVALRRQAATQAKAGIDDIDIHTVRAMLAYRF